jgi:hypothetical protein
MCAKIEIVPTPLFGYANIKLLQGGSQPLAVESDKKNETDGHHREDTYLKYEHYVVLMIV